MSKRDCAIAWCSVAILAITAALLSGASITAQALTSPVSPLPSPTPVAAPPCGELGCTVEGDAQVCRELLPNDRFPTQREFDLIDQYQCTLTACPALDGQILTCRQPLPQPTATLEAAAVPDPTATPTPTATPAPSTWTDAGALWQGVYVLLVNEAGVYCLPELTACE